MQVHYSYGIKVELKKLGFRWNVEAVAWTRRLQDVMEMLGATDESQVTPEALINAAADVQAAPDGSKPKQEPSVMCQDGECLVFGSYDIRDKLKALGFKFNSERGAWAKPLDDIKADCGVEDEESLTLSAILEACDRAGSLHVETGVVQQPYVEHDEADRQVSR